MRKVAATIIVVLFLASVLSVAVPVVRASPAELHVPSEYSTIQAAINAASPGDTIIVAAGTYSEAYVTITKSITLEGANAGVPWNGVRGSETILSHDGLYVFSPAADHITVDGFKFTGTGGRIIDTYSDANYFHLTNCIFDNPGYHSTTGNIQFGGGSHTDMLIDYNYFYDEGDWTFYFGGGPYDSLHIAYNKFNAVGDSIFWGATQLVGGVVEYNEFDGTISGIPGVGTDTMNIGAGGNIIVRHNWFHDQLYTAFQIGIVGGSVTGNTFERIYPWPGYFADAFQLWGGQWGTPVSTNVMIEANIIRYNDIPGADYPSHGIRLRPSGDGPGIDGATIHIHCNSFLDGGARTDAYAIRHQGEPGTILDAEYNWWGDASGPYHPILNPDGKGGKVGDNVDFIPWKTAPEGIVVTIDIKPGSWPNSINRQAKGVISVAVLSCVGFDATLVDPSTITLLGANPVKSSLEDVNGDGKLDLIVHFRIEDLDFTGLGIGEQIVELTGTYLGFPFSGTDTIRIVK